MIRTFEDAFEILGDRVVSNTRDIRRKNLQRRHHVTDIYGMEFTRQGDGGAPATFYLPVAKDMVYLERFGFKLIIQPFVSTVASNGIQSATVNVNETALSISNGQITPNPHDHTTVAHTHNITSGISMTSTTANDFTVSIEGIDITPYLAAQYDGWIEGEGVYPSLDVEKIYDLLQVAGDLEAEGRTTDRELLTRAGYKPVEIASGSPFQVTLSYWVKYPHANQ